MRPAFVLTGIMMFVAIGCAATAMAQGPSAPGNVRASAEGHTVTLFWDTSVFPPYRLRVDAGTAPGVTNVSFLPPTLSPGMVFVSNVPSGTYYVRLRIEKDGQVSGPSNEVVVTVAGCPGVPDPPTLQAASSGQTVDLRWTYTFPAGCSLSALRLEAGRSPGASDVLTLDVPDYHVTWRQFRSVPFGTYYVRVRADRYGVTGPPSNEVRLDIGCLPPPSILNPLATVVGNAVRFSWAYGAGSSADFGLLLEAGSQSGAANIGAIPVPAEAFSGFNVAGAAGVYYTRLRATNACGSTVSPEVPVTLTSECVPPQPIPFADAGIAVGHNAVYLSWQPPVNGGLVTTYDVEVGTAAGQTDLARRTVDGRYAPRLQGDFGEVFTVSTDRAFLRVTSRNACGSARSTEVYATNAGGCWNPPAPQSLSARVDGVIIGGNVALSWSGTGPESPFASFVEIGSRPGASDVFRSPLGVTYPPPFVTTTLPPGRYYARARHVNAACGGNTLSNPSPEVTFVVP